MFWSGLKVVLESAGNPAAGSRGGYSGGPRRDIERVIEDHVDDLLKEREAVHGEPG